jgi:hypothetical protein
MRPAALVAVVLLLAACGDPRPLLSNTADAGPGTGTTPAQCAAASLSGLTYANFGQAFFGAYCTRCHASTVTGAARNGAPIDHNFDTLAGVQPWTSRIDALAGENPTGSPRNTIMPLVLASGDPVPTDLERQRLACFIAEGLYP